MKRYRSILVMMAVALSMTLNVSAAFEKTDRDKKFVDRFSEPATPQNDAKLRGAPGGWDDPRTGGGGALGPVGDNIWVVLGLGLAYGAYVFGRRKEEA